MHRPAPILANDGTRVAFLRSLNILDTDADEAFDRITNAASTITHSPIALISLVDSERQWFKSKVGLDVSETSRDLAFCSHVIAQHGDQIFVVNDALEDERFKYSDLVVGEPRIRFYAGVPLVIDAGNGCRHKIGTLCIIDQKPRKLEDYQSLVMETLAQLVVSEIDKLRAAARPRSEHWPAPASDDATPACGHDWGVAAEPAPAGAEIPYLTAEEARAIWSTLLRQHLESPLHFEAVARDSRHACAGSPGGSATPYDSDSDGTWCEGDDAMDCDL